MNELDVLYKMKFLASMCSLFIVYWHRDRN